MYDIAAIVDIISSISSTLDWDEILAEIAMKTTQVIGVDSCAISLWNRQNNSAIVMADYIAPHILLEEGDIQDEGVAYSLADFPATVRVLQDHVPEIAYVDDLTSDPFERNLLKIFQWAGVLMLPMIFKGQAIGLMELYVEHNENCQFSSDTVRLCQALANQAAVAIKNGQFIAEIKAKREALRQISLRLVNIQEEERRYIARELHDDLGQNLTALRINLDIAIQSLSPDSSVKHRRSIEEAAQLAMHTQQVARNLWLELRPAMLDDLGLVSALHWEFDRYEQRTEQSVHFEEALNGVQLAPELEITLYRIIIEALTNIARHAQAKQIWICLKTEDNSVSICIRDNGVGFDMERWGQALPNRQGLGLIGMRERVELFDGQLQLKSNPGVGTEILVQIPLKLL